MTAVVLFSLIMSWNEYVFHLQNIMRRKDLLNNSLNWARNAFSSPLFSFLTTVGSSQTIFSSSISSCNLTGQQKKRTKEIIMIIKENNLLELTSRNLALSGKKEINKQLLWPVKAGNLEDFKQAKMSRVRVHIQTLWNNVIHILFTAVSSWVQL